MLLPLVCFVAGAAVDTPGRENPWELVMACGFGAAYLALASVWLIHPGPDPRFVYAGMLAPLVFLGLVAGILEKQPALAAGVIGLIAPISLLGGWLGVAVKRRLTARPGATGTAPRPWRTTFWLSAAATALVATTVALLLYLARRAGPTANPNTGFFLFVAFVDAGIMACFRQVYSRGKEPGRRLRRGLLATATLAAFFFGFALIGIATVVGRAPILLPAAITAALAGAVNLAVMVTATATLIGEERMAPASAPSIHL
ncbi:MAG TPA: hypothetical protein VG936_18655 [Lacunisphaera sp.]|nr:hypothetical protein [Lacunisphaera sp.]